MNWAIVGTGYIANEFATGMKEVEGANIVAVVSRSQENGAAFAERYGCENVYTDYKKMLENKDVKIVYVATPNDSHYAYIMEALEQKIPVLSEKPMVDNQWQLDDVLAKAKEKDVFLMEGMWTRFFPAVKKTREWIESGEIGKPLSVYSAFNIKPAYEDWQPWKGGLAHAGRALRDVGIYSVAMANMVFPGEPEKVYATMKSNGEVDECFNMMLQYGDGEFAMLGGAFERASNPVTEIVGEKGRIQIGDEFWHPKKATLILNSGEVEEYIDEYPATGFQYEIREVETCIREGKKESSLYSNKEIITIAKLIETTRKEWGIRYQSDKN